MPYTVLVAANAHKFPVHADIDKMQQLKLMPSDAVNAFMPRFGSAYNVLSPSYGAGTDFHVCILSWADLATSTLCR